MVKAKLTPFITLNGKAKEAMTFYAQVLPDTKIIRMEFYHESPAFSELKEELVLYGSLEIKGTELFFLDMQKEYAAPTPNWSNSLLLDCATEAEFDEIFDLTDKWNFSDETCTLREFLGLNAEEEDIWISESDDALEQFMEQERQTQKNH